MSSSINMLASNETAEEDSPAEIAKEKVSQPTGGYNPSDCIIENGKYCYIDHASGSKYQWDEDKNEWLTVFDRTKPGESQNMQDYEFDGETYIHTDTSTGTTYRWDSEKLVWYESKASKPSGDSKKLAKDSDSEEEFDDDDERAFTRKQIKRQDMSQGTYDFDGKNHTYTDSKDGTVYLWDNEKNAWFPKVDDDFIAHYQMNYGFNTEEAPAPPPKLPVIPETVEKSEEKIPKVDSAQRKQEPTWFNVDDETNTKVYVSNLPSDFTENEFIDLMQKCGLVMKDVDNGKMKIKLYTDPSTGTFKGDALCSYIKVESVKLALSILDGYLVKGKRIKVERAKFTMKGNAYDPSLKPRKKRKKDLAKIKKMQEKLFDWRPEKMRGERDKNERVVIVKNLFEPKIFDDDVGLILEYQQDLREECTKCGRVSKVTIYDRHPDGVAQITFKEAEAADACIQLLNHRWFGKRQITAETWDGKTKYKVAETEEQAKERMKKWEKYIQEEEKKEKQVKRQEDSGDETRSSAGSDDESDEDVPKKKMKNTQSSQERSKVKENGGNEDKNQNDVPGDSCKDELKGGDSEEKSGTGDQN